MILDICFLNTFCRIFEGVLAQFFTHFCLIRIILFIFNYFLHTVKCFQVLLCITNSSI